MAELPEFQRKQYAFAAHIRDPEKNPAPAGIEDRRMAVYRELFFNNIYSLLGKNFPVLKKLCGRQRWRRLIREFMACYQARTPYFLELPKEFLAFLEHTHEPQSDDFPFLTELAHYEWVELALSISRNHDDLSQIDPDGDLLDGVPAMSALAWPLAYRFPVHRISQAYQPKEPPDQPTYLVMYRKPDHEIAVMELNAITAGLLDRISNNDGRRSGRKLLTDLAKDINFEVAALVGHGAEAMLNLRGAGILLGTVNGE